MSEKKFIGGFRAFPPSEGAPDFVMGKLKVTFEDLRDFFIANKEYCKKYEGKTQIDINVTKGKKGLVFTLDTYKKPDNTATKADKPKYPKQQPDPTPELPDDDLPF